MGLAKDEIRNANEGKGCLGKAAPDEPVFILRAQDRFAASLVRDWALMMRMQRGSDHPKYAEAMQLADAMDAWPNRKIPD